MEGKPPLRTQPRSAPGNQNCQNCRLFSLVRAAGGPGHRRGRLNLVSADKRVRKQERSSTVCTEVRGSQSEQLPQFAQDRGVPRDVGSSILNPGQAQ